MDKLKSCPFCGADPEVIVHDDPDEYKYEIRCPYCSQDTVSDIEGVYADFDLVSNDYDKLIEAWNRRAE